MNSLPFVTVIMPVRNEVRFIADSIRAVLAQDYPEERMEILVADGMSEDGTRKIIEALAAEHKNLHLIDNAGQIVPTGLNIAIRQAKGEFIFRFDGHCEPARDYVRRAVEHLRNDGVEGVGGPIETIGKTLWARVIATAMSSRFGVGGSAFRTVKDQARLTDTVAFAAYPRAVVERLGPYDEELVRNQDDEYNYRLRKFGGRLLLSPHLRSRYFSRSSLSSTWRQYFLYGYWKVRVMQKHPRQMCARQFMPPLCVLALLLTASLVPFTRIGLWALAVVVGAYTFACVIASAVAAVRTAQWQGLLLFPFVFATLHVGYGLGFLYGLFVFRDRWAQRNAKASPDWALPEVERS